MSKNLIKVFDDYLNPNAIQNLRVVQDDVIVKKGKKETTEKKIVATDVVFIGSNSQQYIRYMNKTLAEVAAEISSAENGDLIKITTGLTNVKGTGSDTNKAKSTGKRKSR